MRYTTVPLKARPFLFYTLLFFFLNPCPQTKCHHLLWMIFHSHTPLGVFNMPLAQRQKKESGKFWGREVRLFTQKATLIEYSLLMRLIKNALRGSLDSAQTCFAESLSGLDWINSPAAFQVEYCWYSKLMAFVKKGLEHGILLPRFLRWPNLIRSQQFL